MATLEEVQQAAAAESEQSAQESLPFDLRAARWLPTVMGHVGQVGGESLGAMTDLPGMRGLGGVAGRGAMSAAGAGLENEYFKLRGRQPPADVLWEGGLGAATGALPNLLPGVKQFTKGARAAMKASPGAPAEAALKKAVGNMPVGKGGKFILPGLGAAAGMMSHSEGPFVAGVAVEGAREASQRINEGAARLVTHPKFARWFADLAAKHPWIMRNAIAAIGTGGQSLMHREFPDLFAHTVLPAEPVETDSGQPMPSELRGAE